MKVKKVIDNVTCVLMKTKSTSYLIGVNNELKILDSNDELKNLPVNITYLEL